MRGPLRRSLSSALATLAGLGLALASAACATPTVRLAEGPREYVAEDYDVVLRHWTREEELVLSDEVDTVLTATATYESWDFRWAYVVRYAEDFRLTVDQRRFLLERSLAESRQVHQFYVAVHAQKWAWSDLLADNPAWIVRLIDDRGNESVPVEIQAIKKPGALERSYFPYTNPWRRAYRVRFARQRADGRPAIAPEAKWFGLRFAGPQGNQELVWQIEPG
ncbi:MAG: hypothetical protein IT376_20090 [Polyangiaceae bacterium]|nr:hypothetical protein [Polyangiaceae bacterium]